MLLQAEYVDANPLDLVEQVASIHDWIFERADESELSLCVAGEWRDYQISLTWRDDLGGLHLACSVEMKIPADKRSAVRQLLGLINERLWAGHFDLWSDDGLVLFRDSLLLCGGATATPEQCETLLHLALEAAERYYPALQYVVWAGKTPEEALVAAMFETMGQA